MLRASLTPLSGRVPQNLLAGITQRFVPNTALRIYLQSPNAIADAYNPNAPLWTRFKKFFVSAASFARIKQNNSEYSPNRFATAALDQWKRINHAFAAQDVKEMRELVSEMALSKYKSAWKQLGDRRVQWDMNKVKQCSVVAHRVAKIANSEDEFAQVTVKVVSEQTSAVVDRKGRVVGGSATEPKELTEFLVFERNINKAKVAQTKWLYIGRINPDQPQPQPQQITDDSSKPSSSSPSSSPSSSSSSSSTPASQ